MNYSLAQQSNQGGRPYNEDRTAIYTRDNALLLVLADGLGGHAGGDLASQTCVDALGASFNSASDKQLANTDKFLTLSIHYAHYMIHRRALANGFDIETPKTTCVACLITNGVAVWAHSGDSRLYLIRNGEIVKETKDHVASTPNSKGNLAINRCVGGSDLARPEISPPHTIQEGDVFFLASDGAWAEFKPVDLREYIEPSFPSLGLGNLLHELEQRNRNPSDNLSIVLLHCGVKQQDHPLINEAVTNDDLNKMASANLNPNDTSAVKLDVSEMDSTLSEVELFMTELNIKD